MASMLLFLPLCKLLPFTRCTVAAGGILGILLRRGLRTRQPSSLPGLVSCAGIVSTATRLARAGGDSSLLVQHAALLALRYPWHHNLLRTVMGVYGTLSAAAYGVAGRKQDTATLLAQPLTPLIEFLSAALVCGSL